MILHNNPIALAALNASGAGRHKPRFSRGGSKANPVRDFARCRSCRSFDVDACECAS